jgi:hypothetical protein
MIWGSGRARPVKPNARNISTRSFGLGPTGDIEGFVWYKRRRFLISVNRTTAKAAISDLAGGAALCAWFEGIPLFHDAILHELELRQGVAPSRLVAHTFRMESEIDAQGYFLMRKHADMPLTIFELIAVELFKFMEAGIIFELDIEVDSEKVTLSFDLSYGVNERIKAKRVERPSIKLRLVHRHLGLRKRSPERIIRV